jgi:hypothetical protein
VLFGDDRVDDRQAKRWGNERFRLGRACVCRSVWSFHPDSWNRSGKKPDRITKRSPRRNVLFSWFRRSACCHWRHTHARMRQLIRGKARRAASLAHVLFVFYRYRFLLSGTATGVSGGVARGSCVICAGASATSVTDFLNVQSSFHKSIQERVGLKQRQYSPVADLDIAQLSSKFIESESDNLVGR